MLAIQKRNKLGKKSHYIKANEWDEHILNCQFEAILAAAKEVFEGIDYQELERLVNLDRLLIVSNELLTETYIKNPREIIELVDSKFPITGL